MGLLAWGILEDIALDARLDERGRLVAETNVRLIAANLGVSKTTVEKHLTVLRDYGFVLHEELREAESGRYEQVRLRHPPIGVHRALHHRTGATDPASRRREIHATGPAPCDS